MSDWSKQRHQGELGVGISSYPTNGDSAMSRCDVSVFFSFSFCLFLLVVGEWGRGGGGFCLGDLFFVTVFVVSIPKGIT